MAKRKATTTTSTTGQDQDVREEYEDAALENALFPLMLHPGEDRSANYDPDEADTLKVLIGEGREGGKREGELYLGRREKESAGGGGGRHAREVDT
jgi:hypothetical protein